MSWKNVWKFRYLETNSGNHTFGNGFVRRWNIFEFVTIWQSCICFLSCPKLFRFFKSTKSNKISFWIIRMDAWQVIFWQEKEEFSYGIWIRSFFKTKNLSKFSPATLLVSPMSRFLPLFQYLTNFMHGISCIVRKHFRTVVWRKQHFCF